MNVAEASYKVGQALKKIEAGKELSDVIKVLQEKTSPEAWNNFSKLVISNGREGLSHYYGIPNAYYLLEANKENQKVDVLKKEIEEILSIPEFKRLVELGLDFGNAIEELHKELLTPTIPKNFAGTVAKPKLKRKIQDLHVSVQRTSIIKYVFENFGKNDKALEMISDYDSKRSKYPFTKENRLLIQQLASNSEEVNLFFSQELFSSVFEFMKRLIFETHLGIIIELEDTNITSQAVKSIHKFSAITLNTPNPILMNQGFTFRMIRQGEENFGFLKGKQFSFNSDEWNCRLTGYLYPQDDKGLFDKMITKGMQRIQL
ncbi:hypothetical protein ABER98_10890 [Domibacillus aminovorans]|uniref:hypothetical protein n=1 Tax=Domibacillus aminovorans TaxID=29332 RepID=UPI003D1F2E95